MGGQVEVLHLAQGSRRLGGGPPAVAVDIRDDVVAEVLAQRSAGGHVLVDRAPADLHLERGDAVAGYGIAGKGWRWTGAAEWNPHDLRHVAACWMLFDIGLDDRSDAS